jgi:hypothetical protein
VTATSFLFGSLLCFDYAKAGVQSDGRLQVTYATQAEKQQIRVLAVHIIQTCVPLITVLITRVNTITLLHNLFSGERLTL